MVWHANHTRYKYIIISVIVFIQDGRADVVANDAGDRVTPAVVAYRDTEQVIYLVIVNIQLQT